MVGSTEGSDVVGSDDGVIVEGSLVGAMVGSTEGSDEVGSNVGSKDGCGEVGKLLGLNVGSNVGLSVVLNTNPIFRKKVIDMMNTVDLIIKLDRLSVLSVF